MFLLFILFKRQLERNFHLNFCQTAKGVYRRICLEIQFCTEPYLRCQFCPLGDESPKNWWDNVVRHELTVMLSGETASEWHSVHSWSYIMKGRYSLKAYWVCAEGYGWRRHLPNQLPKSLQYLFHHLFQSASFRSSCLYEEILSSSSLNPIVKGLLGSVWT